jgi:hypothetical protein
MAAPLPRDPTKAYRVISHDGWGKTCVGALAQLEQVVTARRIWMPSCAPAGAAPGSGRWREDHSPPGLSPGPQRRRIPQSRAKGVRCS